VGARATLAVFGGAAACAMLLCAGADAAASDPNAHVRPTDKAASRLLDDAVRASATVARLAAELEASDVVVMLSVTMVPGGIGGDMRFLAGTHAVRYLQVRIDNRQPRLEQMRWLAHELQHAAEVGCVTAVRSGADLARLMRRIGRSREAGRLFETEAAITCGKQAERELAAILK
jgi:hypothetical protein